MRGCSGARTRSRPPIRRRQLTEWAGRLQTWAEGKEPKDLDRIDGKHKTEGEPRDVFAYVIHEGKLRAPAAAMALIEKLKE